MKSKPDFFLSAGREVMGDMAIPRACRTIGRLRDPIRDDHMLIEVEPPIIGQVYGLGQHNITKVILSARYQGDTLFPVTEWPCHVYVTRIVDENIIKILMFTREQVEMIAWGMIFRTIEEATDQEGKSND